MIMTSHRSLWQMYGCPEVEPGAQDRGPDLPHRDLSFGGFTRSPCSFTWNVVKPQLTAFLAKHRGEIEMEAQGNNLPSVTWAWPPSCAELSPSHLTSAPLLLSPSRGWLCSQSLSPVTG